MSEVAIAPVAAAAPAAAVPAPAPEAAAAPTSAPAPTEPAKVEAPEFDWDKWDGKSDSLPEPHREVGTKLSGYFTKKYADYDEHKANAERYASEAERHKASYEALINDIGDDPRLTESQQKLQALEGVRAEFEAFQKQVEAEWQADAKAKTASLMSAHPRYFNDPAAVAKYKALAANGWSDPESIIAVLELGDDAVLAAEEHRRLGAPEAAALAHARAVSRAAPAKPKPSVAAQHMAGGPNGGKTPPTPASLGRNDPMPLAEKLKLVASKYAQR